MTNTVKRLLLFFLSIPFLLVLILFLPQYNHLGVIVLLTIIGVLCGFEMMTMMSGLSKPLPRWTALMPGLSPLLAWMVSMEFLPILAVATVFTVAIIWAFTDAIFVKKAEFSQGLSGIGARLLILMYPGWFLWWVARLTWYENAHIVMVIFMLTVFLNDSHAWLFGVLFGRHRNIIAVSPNKSLEGFLGGTLSSVVVILVSSHFFPEILPHPIWQLTLFGLVAAFTSTVGDLVESAIKRAAGVKDSGHVIPGRGGMLDSIDSVLFTAPVFIIFLQMAVQ